LLDENLQRLRGDAVNRHENDQRPSERLGPAAEIGQDAEDGEKAQMNAEFAPGEMVIPEDIPDMSI
jgi:hypothetical protein